MGSAPPAAEDDDGLGSLIPALFAAMLRAILMTCLAGVAIGQLLKGDDDALPVGVAVAFAVLALTWWVEVGLLGSRPRAGLVIEATTGALCLGAGIVGAIIDHPVWLPVALASVLPGMVSVAQRRAWRVPDAPSAPTMPGSRVVELVVVHVLGSAAALAVFAMTLGEVSGPLTSFILVGLLLVVFVWWYGTAIGMAARGRVDDHAVTGLTGLGRRSIRLVDLTSATADVDRQGRSWLSLSDGRTTLTVPATDGLVAKLAALPDVNQHAAPRVGPQAAICVGLLLFVACLAVA